METVETPEGPHRPAVRTIEADRKNLFGTEVRWFAGRNLVFLLIGLFALSFGSFSARGQTIVDDSAVAVLTIVPEFSSFRRGDPLLLSVKLQNPTDKECSLYFLPKVLLERAADKGADDPDDRPEIIYALADISKRSPFWKKTFVGKRDSLEFTIDLNSQKWDLQSQSISANLGLFQVVKKGKYRLWVEMSCDLRKTTVEKRAFLKSNRIDVAVN